MRVARARRLERPLEEAPAALKRAPSLRPLQPRADATVLIVLRHRHHVRVALRRAALADGDLREHEADEPLRVERAEREAAGRARDDEMTTRTQLKVGHAERLALEREARVVLREARHLADA